MPHPFRPSPRPIAAALALAALLLVRGGAGIGSGPAVLRADTGTVVAFIDLVRASKVVALIVVKEAPPEARAWTIEVQRGYRGVERGFLTIGAADADLPLRPGERWLLLASQLGTLDSRAGIIAFRVDAEGAIEPPFDVVEAPATITDLDAIFGPETTPGSSAGAGVTPALPKDALPDLRDVLPVIALGFVLVVLAVSLAAAAVAGRRIRRTR